MHVHINASLFMFTEQNSSAIDIDIHMVFVLSAFLCNIKHI